MHRCYVGGVSVEAVVWLLVGILWIVSIAITFHYSWDKGWKAAESLHEPWRKALMLAQYEMSRKQAN